MGIAVSVNYVLPLSIPDKTVELITDNHNVSFGYRERGSATVLTYSYALNCDGCENMLLECPTSPIRKIFVSAFQLELESAVLCQVWIIETKNQF